jgi:hypothetical protein
MTWVIELEVSYLKKNHKAQSPTNQILKDKIEEKKLNYTKESRTKNSN